LLAGAGVFASFLPGATVLVLALYFILTLAYSFYFKRKVLLDVFALSALYTIRIVAGHTATGIPFSPWLLSFAIFFFLSMAFIKRVSELRKLRSAGGQAPHGRSYQATDLEQLNIFGVASGFLSALVFAFYINSDAVLPLYRHPPVLWLMCPLLLYWMSRIWIVSSRGNLNEDPILFALKDPVTYYVAIISALLLLVASRDWSVLQSLGIR
jgi:4-hydroxybenzoate polyprenyltransferase